MSKNDTSAIDGTENILPNQYDPAWLAKRLASMEIAIGRLSEAVFEMKAIINDFGVKIDTQILREAKMQENIPKIKEKAPNIMMYFKAKYIENQTYWDNKIEWYENEVQTDGPIYRANIFQAHQAQLTNKNPKAVLKTQADILYKSLTKDQKMLIKCDLDSNYD